MRSPNPAVPEQKRPFDPASAEGAAALVELGRWLQDQGYRHACVTPATHARLLQRRPGDSAESLADVFGWNLPFSAALLPAALLAKLVAVGAVRVLDTGLLCSHLRFATLELQGQTGLFCHSAYPTLETDAVFFGPDSHRFVAAIGRMMADTAFAHRSGLRAVELCAGAGPGAWALARCLAEYPPAQLLLADLNAKALACAAINLQLNAGAGSADAQCTQGDLFGDAAGMFDLIVANPPFLRDPAGRAYRHGGETFGTDLSLRIVRESLPRLAPGGCLLLYTGAPMVRGRDIFHDALGALLRQEMFSCAYEEIDPDIFGEELEQPAYAEVERIAAVSLAVQRHRSKAR